MPTWLFSLGTFLAKYWKPIAVALIAGAVLWSTYNKGQHDAIVENKVEQLESVVVIKNEQQKAAANAPRSIDAVVDSLYRGSF